MKLVILLCISVAVYLLSLGLLHGPVCRVFTERPGKRGRVRVPVVIITAAVTVLFAFPVIGAVVPDGPACWFFQRWGNIFLGLILYFFGPLLLIRLGFGLFFRLPFRIRHGQSWQAPKKLCAVLLAGLAVMSLTINIAGARTARDVRVTHYSISKEQLGQDRPLRIVLIGDLHIGVNSSISLYEDMVGQINGQHPDLVLVAGDIVTSSFNAMEDPEAYAAVLRQIESPFGTYVVYGNHDVDEPLFGGFTYAGAENAHRNPAMAQFIKDCGWILLTDEMTRLDELNGLVIAGRRDESRPGDGVDERAPLEIVLAEADQSDSVLLLEHEPVELDKMEDLGIDLVVCGHTHDGQIFPGNVYGRIKDPQSYGIKKWGSCTAVVTSGVGYYGPPIRVGTISEIVVIDAE